MRIISAALSIIPFRGSAVHTGNSEIPGAMSSRPTTGRKRRRSSPVHELATHGGEALLFQNDNTGRKRVNTSALRFVVDVIQDETGKTISSVASELMDASEKVCLENLLTSFTTFSALHSNSIAPSSTIHKKCN